MSALLWDSWSAEWELQEKVSFNGLTKIIRVNAGVTTLDIADVYSAWVRWTGRERQYLQAMRYSGFDSIPGGRTGATFFLMNGWKLVYDPTLVALDGVLFSEDYPTPLWLENGNPVYPAKVSSLVNTSVSYQNVVTGTAASPEEIWSYNNRTLSTLTPEQIASIASAVNQDIKLEEIIKITKIIMALSA